MKHHITWDYLSYRFDGVRRFLVSGEFHYFRVPPADWRRRLELFKETGGNSIATYVPWLIHEPSEGEFRFGDMPGRDLESFLLLCNELDIAVTARPGPYQYSELRYHGTPGWLWDRYPQVAAKDQDGKGRGVACASYLHPLFLEKVEAWFDAVCPVLVRHLASRGGAIAFVQFDNELMGIHDWFGGWDYNRETMGIGREGGRYPAFLQDRYETITRLNSACGLKARTFKDVEPFPARKPETIEERRRVKDYSDFYFGTIAEYAVWLVDALTRRGIDCDFVHNSGSPYMNSYFRETVQRLRGRLILGSDHYYNLDQDWDQNNPTPKYMSKVVYSLDQLRLLGCPPTVWELPGGSAADWPPMTPEDWRCCYFGNVAYGMKGSNYYIFTGGPNPPGCGNTTEIYDYGASIAANGEIRRPLFDAQKDFGAFLNEHAWLAGASRVADFHLGLDWEHSRSGYYFEGRPELGFSNTEAWTLMRKGMMISAQCASYGVSLADLYSDHLLATTDKPLWIATSACMAREVQERLVRFVRAGGHLLLAPVLPELDENFYPCTVLRDFLDGATSVPCPGQFPQLQVGDIRSVYITGGLWQAGQLPAKAQALSHDTVSGAVTGWQMSFEEGGSVIWLGLAWKHHKHEHARMVAWLLARQNCQEPAVRCDNPNIWTSLRSDGERALLFVMNLFSSPMEANLQVRRGSTRIDLGRRRLAPMEVQTIDLGMLSP